MVEYLEAQGKPIPDHYMPPDLMLGVEDWLDAFWWLCRDRQITGYGSGPIPAASIERHCAGWPEWDREAFKTCMIAMDGAYLEASAPPKQGEEKGGLPQPPEE